MRLKLRNPPSCTDWCSCEHLHDYLHEVELPAHRLRHHLSNTDGKIYRRRIRCLELTIDARTREGVLYSLLPRMLGLQELHIRLKAPRYEPSGPLARSILTETRLFQFINPALKSLSLHVEPRYLTQYLWPPFIGLLTHFGSLERLELQGYILFSDIEYTESVVGCRWQLPPQLEELRLRYYAFDAPEATATDATGYYKIQGYEGYSLAFLKPLTRFLRDDPAATPMLKRLTLLLPKAEADDLSTGEPNELEELVEAAGPRGIEVDARADARAMSFPYSATEPGRLYIP